MKNDRREVVVARRFSTMKDGSIKNINELEFAVFCIENMAIRLGVEAEKIYQAFVDKSDILYSYIIPEYERLHTQSKVYILNDISEVMQERGIIV